MASSSAILSMPPNEPVPIESRALGTLSYIRASIDAAGSLTVPGLAGLVMGAIGLAAAGIALIPALAADWLAIWIIAAAAAGAIGAALIARQASRNGSLLSAPFRKFLLCLSPSLFAGAVLTFVLWQASLERYIPGTWLLLYGCGVIAASTTTNARHLRVIACMGGVFLLLGAAAFIAPLGTHNLLLGAGFGALHLFSGVLIGRLDHGDK